MRLRIAVVVLASCCLLLPGAPSPAPAGEKVVVFHAGSLDVPMQKMEEAFEKRHPDIEVRRRAGGSTKMARLISEEGRQADIMASADYKVIDNHLIPEHAAWNIRFASNRLVLAYTERSRYASEITSENWYEILQREEVEWGHSDPDLDPCGYRALMVMQLAEVFHGPDGLYRDLLAVRTKENVRPSSAELVDMLKSGRLDYAWEYLSVAVQHDLQYVDLDTHINLGDYRMNGFYRRAAVEVSGTRPGSTVTKRGKSITYGVTMTRDAACPEEAVHFLGFMLDPDGGLQILKRMGQPPFVPARVPSQDMLQELPADLRTLVEVRE